VNWPWHRDWQIQPIDQHWNGSESSFIVRDGWEPFGVSAVPNIQDPQNWIRIWTRRRERGFRRKQYEIKIQQAGWGGHQVILHLSGGWEPFGVSDSFGNHLIWFRRRV
jgi:hypothetical protein